MRFFVREVLPLLILAGIIIVFGIFPYLRSQARIEALKQNQSYQCKINKIFIDFATTAEHARSGTASLLQNRLGARLKKLNQEAAHDYKKDIVDLKKLPPLNC